MATVNLFNADSGIPNQLNLGNEIHRGGEGVIYKDKDGRFAIKVYHRQESKEAKRLLLEKVRMLGKSLTAEEKAFLCWPVALIRDIDGAQCTGCVTPYLQDKPLLNYILPKGATKQLQLGTSWANYLQMARGVANAIAVLHGKGCAHSDISAKNFLANPKSGDTVLLDLDGLVVEGFLPSQVSGTIGYMAPEIISDQRPPTERSDRHSLSVLIFETLLFRNPMEPKICYDADNDINDAKIGFGKEAVFSEHSDDKRNCPSRLGIPLTQQGVLSYRMLTPRLQSLIELAFIDGLRNPDKRPMAREWISALSWTVDEIWQCLNCRQYFPYPHWVWPISARVCPFCGKSITSPLPSVFRLYEPRSSGKYTVVRQRRVVLGHQWSLYADVVEPNRDPAIKRKGTARIGHLEWDGKMRVNRLVNDEGGLWQMRPNDKDSTIKAAKGESLPLSAEGFISFGEGRRLLFVQE